MPSIPLGKPIANDLSKITGDYASASMDRVLFAQWTQWVIAGSPSSPSYGLYREKQRFPQQQAISQVQRLFGQSTWQINSDNTVKIVCPAGTFSGTLDNLYNEIPFKASAMNGAHQQAKISGRIERIDSNRIIAHLNIALSKGNQDITAEFDQKLRKIR